MFQQHMAWPKSKTSLGKNPGTRAAATAAAWRQELIVLGVHRATVSQVVKRLSSNQVTSSWLLQGC